MQEGIALIVSVLMNQLGLISRHEVEIDTNMPNVPTWVNATESRESANASKDTKEKPALVSRVPIIALVMALVST